MAGLTISQISTIAGVASTATTGKGLSDHALSFVTGKDCNLVESVLRKDRKLCETPGSPATQEDFKGVFTASKPKDEATPVKTVEVQQATLALITVPKSNMEKPGRRYAMVPGPMNEAGLPTARVIVFPDPRPAVPSTVSPEMVASAVMPPIPKPRSP